MVIVIGMCFCFSGTSSPHNDSYSYQLMTWLRAHWHYCLKFIYVVELKQGFHLHHKAHCRWLEKRIQSPFGWFTNNCIHTLCSMTDHGIISKFCVNVMYILASFFFPVQMGDKIYKFTVTRVQLKTWKAPKHTKVNCWNRLDITYYHWMLSKQ